MKSEQAGDLVRRARTEAGVTQVALAERAGVHWRTVNQIENLAREQRGRWSTIVTLLRVLGYRVRVERMSDGAESSCTNGAES